MTDNTAGTTRTFGTNPLAMYDLTAPCDRYTADQLKDWCRIYCKRWCFQQEQGDETGYLHFQMRVSLTAKKRLATMISWMSTNMPAIRVSATSNPTFYAGNEFYVMKEDTRIDGPWTDRDDVNPAKIPIRLRTEPNWYPWQREVLNMIATTPDDRTINVIVDAVGQKGKSVLSLYLMAHQRAQRIPVQKDPRDIMRMIMNCPKRTCYFIDLPRATSHQNQHTMYTAIEEIKNGYCYDDRYKFTQELFEPPHVWVFTNILPDLNFVSKDRWKLWTITPTKVLAPLQGEPIPMELVIHQA